MDTVIDRKTFFKRLAYLIVFIFILNFLAGKLYWYYDIWWFDMPMHTLGGFWIGLASLYFFPITDKSFNSILKILLLILLVGIGWEVFEIVFNNVLARMTFNTLDTISDVCFDLAGGTIALLYYFKGIMLQSI
jgi:hypothetical protein